MEGRGKRKRTHTASNEKEVREGFVVVPQLCVCWYTYQIAGYLLTPGKSRLVMIKH